MKDIVLQGLAALFIGCNFTILLFVLFHVRKIAKLQAHLEKQLQVLHNNKEVQHNNELKEEIRHRLHMHALQIRDVVYKQTKSPHPRAIEEIPGMVSYNVETIYKTFAAEKAKGIEEFFDYYNEYVEVFWKTQIKKVFRANSNNGFNEKEQIAAASMQLLNKLDRHLAFFL